MPGTTKKQFKPGEILVHEGERGDCAYIIEAGNVEILVQREGQTIQIGTRGPGSLVGEMAMVDDKPRTATVRAIDECSVIEITRDDFARRIESADPVLSMVMRVITARYRDMFARAEAIRLEPANLAAESAERGGATHDVALSALRLHSELRLALERGELVLFYQPIIDIQKMKIAGFEALMRWMHPERGMISPGIFIPVAEDSGLILEISRFTLDASCDAAVRLQAAASKELIGDDPLFIGVNYSGRDFSEGEVIHHLAATLAAKHIDPRQIHLEITETLLMQEPEVARAELEKCRALGLNISIDDFGSGYSSLSYLHHFPIDTLKIDQSFIRSMSTHAGSLVLVKSILGLARNLGMKVIAEGVETAQDATTLRALGCEYIQGYWFSKPLPFDAAIRFVQTWQPPPMENAEQ